MDYIHEIILEALSDENGLRCIKVKSVKCKEVVNIPDNLEEWDEEEDEA